MGQILNFREVVNDCDLKDLGFCGEPFTWITLRNWGIKEQLDRVLANIAWCNLFTNHSVTHLKPCKSDHVLLALVFLGGGHRNSHTQTLFHFEEMQIGHNDCADIMKQAGSTEVAGYPKYQMQRSVGGDAVLDALDHRFSTEMTEILKAEFSSDEVRAALFQMHFSKSPSPDGMPLVFFQKFWDIVDLDVMNVVLSFLSLGKILKKINFTYVTLIPKVNKPKEMGHLQPIILSNVLHKIAAKEELALLMGVTRVDRHKKYLDMPTLVGRNRGQELLVKVLAQAIPLYVMKCFFIPRYFCDDLNWLVARFWNMYAFNLAILAKQGWRIM
ncbi:hypothetical protein FF1_046470 [Malus domestica]